MKVLAVLFFLGLSLHSGRCDCTGKTSTLATNTDLYCAVGPSFLGGFVFRGKPTADPVDTTLPANNIREDEFKITQVFKGDWDMTVTDKVVVKYTHDPLSGCNDYPYDQDGLENVIFGYLENNKVNIMDCSEVTVYDCMEEQAVFNTYTTNEPSCDSGGDGGDGGDGGFPGF